MRIVAPVGYRNGFGRVKSRENQKRREEKRREEKRRE
jgi:hypothetical protein